MNRWIDGFTDGSIDLLMYSSMDQWFGGSMDQLIGGPVEGIES